MGSAIAAWFASKGVGLLLGALAKLILDGWNEYLFAATLITNSSLWVTSVGLASFVGELSTPVELVFAGATIFTAGPIVFFLLTQRYVVGGLTGGAVKG